MSGQEEGGLFETERGPSSGKQLDEIAVPVLDVVSFALCCSLGLFLVMWDGVIALERGGEHDRSEKAVGEDGRERGGGEEERRCFEEVGEEA